MQLQVKLDVTPLQPLVAQSICDQGLTPLAALNRAVQEHLEDAFVKALGGALLKGPIASVAFGTNGQRLPGALSALAEHGAKAYRVEVKFSTAPNVSIEGLSLITQGISVPPMVFGSGERQTFVVRSKMLKRQANHLIMFWYLHVPGSFFAPIFNIVKDRGPDVPSLPNFDVVESHSHLGLASYFHPIRGDMRFCECSKAFHRDLRQRAQESVTQQEAEHPILRSGLKGESWAHKVKELFQDDIKYEAGLCHICVASRSLVDLTRLYGHPTTTKVEAFVNQVAFDRGIDKTTARVHLMQHFGISRWLREDAIYRGICTLFPDQKVLREASPSWLGRMRLDIYLPDLGFAVEHQGEQHYRPIKVFGGDEAHQRVVERDALKRQLCAENGVEVVDIRFDAPITAAALAQRFKRFTK